MAGVTINIPNILPGNNILKTMIIVIDMDNTLTDEFGATARPGIADFLTKLKSDGHMLILWTNSTKERAATILKEHRLKAFFTKFIFRENYDPKNTGLNKDIRKVKGDLLIDDDPAEINYMKQINKKGILVTSYRNGKNIDQDELTRLYQEIKGMKSILHFY